MSLVYLRDSKETNVAGWGKQRKVESAGFEASVRTLAFGHRWDTSGKLEQSTRGVTGLTYVWRECDL